MRLQRFMADAGIASRRKCEEYIAAGRVKVNGSVAAVGCVVEAGDCVEFDGKVISAQEEKITVILNKPQGVVCTASDPEGRRTVVDYVKELPYRLYNVGRLDYDSEGLIVLTNDGELAHRMMHPSFEISKVYHVVCSGKLTPAEADRLKRGVVLDDGITAPAEVNNLKLLKNGNTAFDITIHEGRNRQVRRMVAAIGHDTLLLRRIKEGPLELGNLKGGEWRYITKEELTELRTFLQA